ncbi:MAG: hypothetical protein Tsb0020_22290 [Haliangiales bacterium]
MLALVGTACFSPQYRDDVACSQADTCPPGHQCGSDGICRATPINAPPPADAEPTPAPVRVDAAAGPDAASAEPPDASPPDAIPPDARPGCDQITCAEQAACVDPDSPTPCQCDPGYQGDGFTCADIDECTQTPPLCDVNASCSNQPGSFTCQCDPGYLGDGESCARPSSCAALRAADPTAPSGTYTLDGDGSGPAPAFDTHCDMNADGGGFTLVAAIVNDGTRRWNSLSAWTSATSFGQLGERTAADFKSSAFASVAGTDYLVRTTDYAFAFRDLLPATDLADFIASALPDECSRAYERSAPDWHEGLSDAQASVLGFVLRPLDSNASCFPGTNENALIGHNLATCCWAGGLGNTPAGQATWSTHDLSLLTRARLIPVSCSAGVYPCNEAGLAVADSSFCYDTSCKVPYAEIYVR